jgi:hypothetical protein
LTFYAFRSSNHFDRAVDKGDKFGQAEQKDLGTSDRLNARGNRPLPEIATNISPYLRHKSDTASADRK